MHWNALVLCIYSKCIGCIFCRIASLDEGARLKWGSCLQVSLIFLINLWHAQFLDICAICTFWPGVLHTHKPSLQIFSHNALQFVPGANNCGFVHRDRGRHCHNHVHNHNHNHYHNYNRDPGSHCHNNYFTSTETNNVPICTAATTIWAASPIYQDTICPKIKFTTSRNSCLLQRGGSVWECWPNYHWFCEYRPFLQGGGGVWEGGQPGHLLHQPWIPLPLLHCFLPGEEGGFHPG